MRVHKPNFTRPSATSSITTSGAVLQPTSASSAMGQIFSNDNSAPPMPEGISILTWNVWFDSTGQIERHEAVLQKISTLKPDVACFQEVTAVFLDLLRKSTDIMEEYSVSPNQIHRYGCITIVKKKWKPKFHEIEFESDMGRSLILAQMESFVVGNVHLESLNYEQVRKQQLQVCATVLQRTTNAIVVGDFNFDATKTWGDWRKSTPAKTVANPENGVLAKVMPGWLDAWPAMKGVGDAGYTFDGLTNPKCCRDRQEQMRYDRIMVKGSSKLAFSTITMLGQDAINDWGLKPSDHYGLHLTLEASDGPIKELRHSNTRR